MNKLNYLLLVTIFLSFEIRADELGRLFTTPAQRSMLEDLRNSKPQTPEHIVKQYEQVEIIDANSEAVFLDEEVIEVIPVLEEPISLKGIVSRKKGNHTAWINENNTYEGGMIEENISVNPRTIKRDSVQVKLPDRTTNITLKVGETYIPEVVSEE